MSNFQYTASDVHGKMVRGELPAADSHELVSLLQELGLFLVSCKIIDPIPQEQQAQAENEAPPEAEPLPADQEKSQITSRHLLALAALLIAGIGLGTSKVYHRLHPTSMTDTINLRMSQIHPEMTRSEVEKILGSPRTHSENPEHTQYVVPPNFIWEVAYGTEGGPGSGQNRVSHTGHRLYQSR